MISITTLLTYLGMIFAVVILCALIGLPFALLASWIRKKRELKNIPDKIKREVEDAKEIRHADRGREPKYIPVEQGVRPANNRTEERDYRLPDERDSLKPISNEPVAVEGNSRNERYSREDKERDKSIRRTIGWNPI